jgi:hypothetical protein
MKRRHHIAAGILAVGIIAVLALLVSLPEPDIAKATLDQIRPGMTMEEVQAVVGMPPTIEVGARRIGTTSYVSWRNPDGSGLEIVVDEVDGVLEQRWHDSAETIGDKVRRWVRWPWW